MLKSFFNKQQVQSKTRPQGKLLTCAKCGLYQYARNPKMGVSGKGKKKILNITGYMTDTEDFKNKRWTTDAGRFLKLEYRKLGIDIEEDCWNYSATQCYSKDANGFSISCCRSHVRGLIDKYKPDLIVAFGEQALESLCGDRVKSFSSSLTRWRGFHIPDRHYKAYITPILHPEVVLEEDQEQFYTIFRQDLESALTCLNKEFPKNQEYEKQVEIIDDLSLLSNLKEGKIAFDIESTGLAPYDKGHRIISASLCDEDEKCYSFLIPKTYKEKEYLLNILQSDKYEIIIQNTAFERKWVKEKFRLEIANYGIDTQLAQHIVNNARGITGLKFQSYVYLGMESYDTAVEDYIKSDDNKNPNAKNKMLLMAKENPEELLLYGGLDTLLTMKIAKIHEQKIKDERLSEAYELFHDGNIALSKASEVGFRIDTEYCEETIKNLNGEIAKLEQEVLETSFCSLWKKVFKEKFNMNSGQQLAYILYNVRKLEPPKFTEKGQGSVDDDSLTKLDLPELKKLLRIRKLRKVKKTYLENYVTQAVDDTLHPTFNLNNVVSFRGSCNSPNFQNLSKNDPEIGKLVRTAIIPQKGHQILEVDYKSLEVLIGCCYHKDKNMIRYLQDGTADMHADVCSQIFKIDCDKNIKWHAKLRSATKNSYIFPIFYGSIGLMCAEYFCNGWLDLPKSVWKKGQGILLHDDYYISDHMLSIGIKSYSEFEKHLSKIEKDFWENRFMEYGKWRVQLWKKYQKQGYLISKTGFKYTSLMKKKNVLNFCIQGSAFHTLLWSLIELDKIFDEMGLQTKILGNVHDSILFDVEPSELETIKPIIKRVMTKDVREHFKWITIPLDIDADISEVDGNWFDMKHTNI